MHWQSKRALVTWQCLCGCGRTLACCTVCNLVSRRRHIVVPMTQTISVTLAFVETREGAFAVLESNIFWQNCFGKICCFSGQHRHPVTFQQREGDTDGLCHRHHHSSSVTVNMEREFAYHVIATDGLATTLQPQFCMLTHCYQGTRTVSLAIISWRVPVMNTSISGAGSYAEHGKQHQALTYIWQKPVT